MQKRIYLHAGAHRTGSSSFQLCLHENRALLTEQGFDLAYPGRDGVPGGKLKLRLPGPRHGTGNAAKFAASVRDAVARFSPDPARALILSDENVPGRMFHFYQGQFFPAAAARMRATRDGFGDARLELVYVLRDYAGLYVSAYRKRAEDNAVQPFDGLVPAFLGMDRGWPELVREMRDILRPDRFLVIPYARRGSSAAMLARFVPDISEDTLSEPRQAVNLSATDAALLDLQMRYRSGEALSRPEWKAIIASHAEDCARRGFADFPADALAQLEARYAKDLARIADIDGIDLA